MYRIIRKHGLSRDIINRPSLALCTIAELHELCADGQITPEDVQLEMRRRLTPPRPGFWKGPPR